VRQRLASGSGREAGPGCRGAAVRQRLASGSGREAGPGCRGAVVRRRRARGERARARQARGATLLLFLLVVVVLSAMQILRGFNAEATARHHAEELARTGAALAEAKRVLLGAAVVHEAWLPAGRGPGRLSCAALDSGLIADGGACGGGPRSTGLFPRTLDPATRPPLPLILDGSGTPLVFVMDTRWRKGTTDAIHRGHTPRVHLDGAPVVALLFAPGAVRAGQSRPPGPFAIEHYLEDPENTNGDAGGFHVSPSVGVGNDTVLAITHTELLCAIRPRVRAARRLQEAFNVDPTKPPPPAWYGSEGWNDDNGAGLTRAAEIETLVCSNRAL